MINLINQALPYGVLISHAFFVLILLALIFHKSWGGTIAKVVGKNAILLAFLTALASILGSLFYSEFVGYTPCVLCWWQRVLIYPQVLIFGLALWKGKKDAFFYAIPLAVISTVIALYHQYVYMGGESLLPCTALGGACSKIYVMAFGYITIPMMSLTATLFILLFAFSHKIHENRHA